MTLAPTLRPYQRDAIEALVTAKRAGHTRLLLKSATGTGKTVTFAAMLSDPDLAPDYGAMLVIAHREELLEQAAAKLQAAHPGKWVAIEQADRVAPPSAEIIVASIQTLAATKFARLHRLIREHGIFRLVVIDEAHHAAASTYRTALVHLGFLPKGEASEDNNIDAPKYDDVEKMQAALAGWDAICPKDRLLVGVTATPNRTDAIGLGCVFQTLAYDYALRDAIRDGWLVKLVPWVIETDVSLDAVRTSRGDFQQNDLAEAVNTGPRNELAVAGWLERAKDRSTLAFTVDVAHAHDLAGAFNARGIPAAAISGETPKDERRDSLARYTAGELLVLTNCMVLTEGTDLPRTSCILHAKPTKSATLYEQMTGRGLRIHPGKTDCIILDVVDVARRHSLQSSADLYGLPPGFKAEGKSLDEAKDEIDEFLRAHPGANLGTVKSLKDLKARAVTFDLWAIRPLEAYGVGLKRTWIRSGEEEFSLSYPWQEGTETLKVRPNILGQYEVVASYRERPAAPTWRQVVSPDRTVLTGARTAAEALGRAERYLSTERRAVTAITSQNAAWRSRPATEKQIGLLKRRHVPVKPGMTMGEVSDLINLSNTRRG